MSAIITITFNPALDKSTTIPALVPEKKIKCSAPIYGAGGGGINVARAIKKLGGDATAFYLAGGYAGQKITSILDLEYVQSEVTGIQGLTRENLVVFDSASGKQYLFDMPGPIINEQEWQQFLNSIENSVDVKYIVASGSLPAGIPTDIFARIALIARKKKAKFIVDTSGEGLKMAVNEGVYLIKPNLRELGLLVGKEELPVVLAEQAAKQIINNGKCEGIVVSLGDKGAMLITKENTHHIIPPPVMIQSTVGAGDSLVAGIVLSLERNCSLVEAVQYGVASGTAATMNPGTQLCTKTQADQLFRLIRVKELLQC
ncbi:MAG TPA: 1-phosphofructokinase family hexose kinase [Mucilaginibacter sp.]|jgi:6-phosphofructokinase 2|nr:1-phosphofructokinase family hexose kinase [Mucilaginibacter sp.]